MPRAKKGHAISAARRGPLELRKLRVLKEGAKRRNDLETWRRAKAVLGYIGGIAVIELSGKLDVTRGSINRWLQWYEAEGVDGLKTKKAAGAAPRLTPDQFDELAGRIDAGPQASGFVTGVWTGPMVGELIRRCFGVSFHNHYIPRLLNTIGFSVQRPRKRLARADLEKQAVWLKKRFPAIKKKRPRAAESSSSKTKPASGSTAHSIEPGPESDVSLGSIPSASERLRISSEP